MFCALAPWLAIMAIIAGCGAPSNNQVSREADAKDGPGVIHATEALTNIDPAVRAASSQAKRLTYTSRSGVNDAYTHVTGSVFVPKGKSPEGGFPIVALGHATEGTTSDCAPSLFPDLLQAAPTVAALLDAGYVVSVPDYQGLGHPADGDQTYHPYLDSTTAGYNMIDAVRAARTAVPDTSTAWAALGSDEGGQAAWAANELAESYGYGLKLIGTASVSPIANVEGIADAAQAGTLTPAQKPVLVAFLAALKEEYEYDVDLDDYRRGAAAQHWDQMLACQSDGVARRAQLAAEIAPDDLRPADAEALTRLRGYLQKTNLPQGPAQAPMLVMYGEQDAVTPAAWTRHALDRACGMGDVIAIELRPDAARGQIDPVAALGWIAARFASAPAPNDCPSSAASPAPAGAPHG